MGGHGQAPMFLRAPADRLGSPCIAPARACCCCRLTPRVLPGFGLGDAVTSVARSPPPNKKHDPWGGDRDEQGEKPGEQTGGTEWLHHSEEDMLSEYRQTLVAHQRDWEVDLRGGAAESIELRDGALGGEQTGNYFELLVEFSLLEETRSLVEAHRCFRGMQQVMWVFISDILDDGQR